MWESESIGQLGSTPWAHVFAVWYIPQILGEPPEGCELAVLWHDHEVGSYSTMGIRWDLCENPDPPSDYIQRCEKLIDLLEEQGLLNFEVLDPEYMCEFLKDVG